MTEQQQNLPAVVQTRAVVSEPADVDGWRDGWRETAELAAYIADTEFVPRALRGRAPAAAAAMLYGREVGMPPMTALTSVHIIEGSPSLSAEQMRSMVLAAGHDLEFVESTGARCVVRGRRRGSETWTTVEWSIDMARAAGLLGKTNWKSWPRRMLQARASSELCEMVFPDVIRGLRAAEVVEDEADELEAGETAAAPRATSPVKRTRKAASPKSAAPELPRSTAPQTPAAGPVISRPGRGPAVPLPGEAGYDDVSSGSETPVSDAGDPAAVAGPEADRGPGTAPDPDTPRPVDPTYPAGGNVPADDAQDGRTQAGDNPVDESPADDVVDAEIVGETPPAPISGVRPAQRRMILAKFASLGLKGDDTRAERLRLSGILVGRPIGSTNDLSKDEAGTLIDALALCNSLEQLVQVAEQTEAAESGDE